MAQRLVQEVWMKGPADHTQRLLLLAIADLADEQGACTPRVQGLGDRLCQSEGDVLTVLHALEEGGYISVAACQENPERVGIQVNAAGSAKGRVAKPKETVKPPPTEAARTRPRGKAANEAGESPTATRLLSQVWKHARIGGRAFLLLLAIARHAQEGGICTAPLQKVARDARVDQCRAHRLLSLLQDAGCVGVRPEFQTGPNLVIRVNRFFLEPVEGPASQAALAASFVAYKVQR